VWNAVVTGSSLAGQVQTNPQHTNFSVVGDVTPGADGGIEAHNSQYRHLSGSATRAH
jgi:hypothetical protein